jgi:hypothetical protein
MVNRGHTLTQQIGGALMAVGTKGIIQQGVYNAIGKVRECRWVHIMQTGGKMDQTYAGPLSLQPAFVQSIIDDLIMSSWQIAFGRNIV